MAMAMAMIWCGRLSLLLVLLASFTLSPIIAGDEGVVVDIESRLPRQSKEALKLGCGTPWIELKAGDHYTLQLKPHEDALECNAQWLPYISTWDAYDANADRPHLRFNNTVFWRITEDGFYRSWDHGVGSSSWKKILGWHTE